MDLKALQAVSLTTVSFIHHNNHAPYEFRMPLYDMERLAFSWHVPVRFDCVRCRNWEAVIVALKLDGYTSCALSASNTHTFISLSTVVCCI